MKSISRKIVNNFIKKKLTLSLVESCTGGLLSSKITSVKDSSKIFTLGLVTYSNQAKIKVLKVKKKLISKYGAVSEEVCVSMIKNLNKISKSNISISITGIAGPGGGSLKKPVGLVFIGIKNASKIKVYKCLFKNKSRSFIQNSAVKKSLMIILDSIK